MSTNNKARRAEKKRREAERERRRRAEDVGNNRFGGPRPGTRENDETNAARGERGERGGCADTTASRRLSDDLAWRGAIGDAVTAIHTRSRSRFDDAVRRIVQVSSDGECRGPWFLQEEIISTLSALWSNGWQPLDAAHVIGRLLEPSHRSLLIEAMSIEHQRSRLNVGQRWEAQVQMLKGTEVASDPLFGKLEERALEVWATTAVQLFAALLSLRRLEVLMPPPGSPDVLLHQRSAHLDEKVLAKVRGLLAKAESTSFEAEAEAFTAKAQELMARHAIDLAMVSARRSVKDTPTARRVHLDDPYISAKSILLSVVADRNNCRAVFDSPFGMSTVFGFDDDLAITELLFTSLLTQATSAMVAAGRSIDGVGVSRTRSFRQSFLVAYANRIGERLREARESATAEASREMGDGFLPVLAARKSEVDEAMRAVFPITRSRAAAVSNAAGWAAGRDAANGASLKIAERLHA